MRLGLWHNKTLSMERNIDKNQLIVIYCILYTFEVHLLYKSGNAAPTLGNLMGQKSCVSMFGFHTDIGI